MKWDDYFVFGASTLFSGCVSGILSAANRYLPLSWVAVGLGAVAVLAVWVGVYEKKRQEKASAEEAAAFKIRMEKIDEEAV
jgi:hypothetical protein